MHEWEGILKDMEFGHGAISSPAEKRKAERIKSREVGLKHKGTGAVVRLNDNGTIDAFAGPQLGMRMDPRTNSISFIGDVVNVSAGRFNVKTKQYGFTWNGRAFDPEQLQESEAMTDRRERKYYSDMLIDMMDAAGIETHREES